MARYKICSRTYFDFAVEWPDASEDQPCPIRRNTSGGPAPASSKAPASSSIGTASRTSRSTKRAECSKTTAALTRGGFYNHFKTKDELYAETLTAFANGRQEQGCETASRCGPEVARQVFNHYVSRQHLENLDRQCPLIALPSDTARAGPAVRSAYQTVLEILVRMFEANLQPDNGISARQQGLAIAATCVGAMVLARTVEDSELADEICEAARAFASESLVTAPVTRP